MTDLATNIISGNRRALARAITLAESTRADHRVEAEALLATLLPNCGKSIRVGISGAPGVGKSSFIETFGLSLVEQGHKVGVLAVDPSSPPFNLILASSWNAPDWEVSDRTNI